MYHYQYITLYPKQKAPKGFEVKRTGPQRGLSAIAGFTHKLRTSGEVTPP